MRFELMKLFSEVGDLHQSFVTAPVKDYSQERLEELKRRYAELTKVSKSSSPSHRLAPNLPRHHNTPSEMDRGSDFWPSGQPLRTTANEHPVRLPKFPPFPASFAICTGAKLS
jgi:hypothetical protein